jgi:tight adherence protein C
LSLPEEGWERSPLRTRFMNAGWRRASAPALFFAAKPCWPCCFPPCWPAAASAMAAQLRSVLLLLLCRAAVGYYLPNWCWPARLLSQRDIFENFPDALDLLTVCVEAGLSLDARWRRLARDPPQERGAGANCSWCAGNARRQRQGKALRNLALRSVEDVDTLVTMLIQAERFGTSMGDRCACIRKPARQAQPARRGSGGQDRPEAAVPADLLASSPR